MFVGSGAFGSGSSAENNNKRGSWHWVHWTASLVGGLVHGGVYALVPPWSMVPVVKGNGNGNGEGAKGQA